jgi:hypothetical protein
MEPETKSRLTNRTIWVRGLYMLFFVIAYAVAETIVVLVSLFQFVSVLLTGSVSDTVLRFGTNVSKYVYQILQFETFNDETLPFPFSDWPDDEPGTSPWQDEPRGVEDAPTEPTPLDEADAGDEPSADDPSDSDSSEQESPGENPEDPRP